MASDRTDIDVVLRQINQRLRKLEKSDSEKTEEIGRLNRVINQKDVEIHNLKTELASTKAELAVAKERIKELEGADDDTSCIARSVIVGMPKGRSLPLLFLTLTLFNG